MDGFHVLTPPPPCLRNFQNALPPPMPSEFQSLTPPTIQNVRSFWNLIFDSLVPFYDPQGYDLAVPGD